MSDAATAAERPAPDAALALGLTEAEYELVVREAGRPPNQVELAMYSLLWSEHCAYKHSKRLLRTLPTRGQHVVMGPGENAGAVDVGAGWCARSRSSRTTTRARSSPSRARPPAWAGSCATSSRSARARSRCSTRCASASRTAGELDARSRYLLDGAVCGIGHYGNSIGVPDGRRRGLLRGALRAELPGQRDGARPRPRASS